MAPRHEPIDRIEEEETDYRPIEWKRVFARKYWIYHFLGLVALGATLWLIIKHDDIVNTLRPFSEKVRDIPAGFLIPVAIFIVISIPPLFGHEIIALLCGVVYGLWVGFAITAAGTFLGEILTWFLFMYLLRRKAAKFNRTNVNYAALTRLTQEGGFWRRFFVITLIRFSAIPSHFSTAVFSTCGVGFWSFAAATAISLPKQFFLVYLGVLFLEGADSDSKIKTIVMVIGFLLTVVAAGWIWWRMRDIKVILLEEQAQRRAQREMTTVPKAPGQLGGEGSSLSGVDSRTSQPASIYGLSAPPPYYGRYQHVASTDSLPVRETEPHRMV